MPPELAPAFAPAFTGTRRYSIERELGSGGMGVVYEAIDLERNARIALKALTQRDALNIYRLKNEFRQLADLSHPNLVALHELCCENGSWFFTMELVDGVSFDLYVCESSMSSHPPADARSVATVAGRIVRDVSTTLSQRAIGSEYQLARPVCNVRRLRRVLRQLVEAVAALHNAGKLHRDIKPSNVLVTPEERVVVLDFGLVSSSTSVEPEPDAAERTIGGCVFGTPAYMSPEQAAGEQVTTASDWYAVGVMLYEALTGQLPFDGSVLEILRQKEELEPAPPSSILSGIPHDLDELCRELLHRDPKLRPAGVDILRRVTGHAAAPMIFDAQSTTAAPRGELFVGRETHLAALRDAFEAAKSGKPVTVLVQGFSGMGKTALVRCFANELIQRGEAVVLRGRCYERESVPYKAFDSIIDALSRYLMRLPAQQAAGLLPRNVQSLARLFPVLRRVKAIAHARAPKHLPLDAHEIRKHGFAALKELLLRISDFQPLVLNIDDLQWADMDSARLLAFLVGRPDPPPLLLVGTYRRDEAITSPFLRYILSEAGLGDDPTSLRELAVDALTPQETLALCRGLLADLPTTHALAAAGIGAESEGVPFFINELVQHVRGHAERGGLQPNIEALSLETVVLERIRSLPRDAQRLLEALAVAGGPIEQGVALQAAGLSVGNRSALLSLRAARLIRTRGTRQTDEAEVYHDRVRETVVAAMHPEGVRLMHARIAGAIEAFGISDPERLVAHYNGAGDGVRAGETAVQAAHRAAQKLAFSRAAELFRSAIKLHAKDDPLQGELHKHLGEALANSGRGAQAAEAYVAAADRAVPSEQPTLMRLAAQQYLRSGRIEEGSAITCALLERAGVPWPRTTGQAIGSIVWNRAAISLREQLSSTAPLTTVSDIPLAQLERLDVLGSAFRELGVIDPLRGMALHTRHLREALRAGEPHRLLLGLAWEALHTAFLGGARRDAKARAILERVELLAQQAGTPYALATSKLALAGCQFFFARFREALSSAIAAGAIFRESCPGTSWEQNLLNTFRLGAIEEVGNLMDIAREAPELARTARERDDLSSRGFLTVSVPVAHLMANDPAAALSVLDEHRESVLDTFTTNHLWVVHRTIDTYLYMGRGPEALAHHLEQWPAFAKSYLIRAKPLYVLGHWFLARAALGAAVEGGSADALAVAERAARVLERSGRTDGASWALLARAGIANVRGDASAARAILERGIEQCRAHQLDLFALYAERNLGALSGGVQGAALVERVDQELRKQGVCEPRLWTATYCPGFRPTV